VADWISLKITNELPSSNQAGIVARSARRLERAAWGRGINRDKFLSAVGGDSHEYAPSEIERRLLERCSIYRDRNLS
jgi:hypothetical protein